MWEWVLIIGAAVLLAILGVVIVISVMALGSWVKEKWL